MDVWIALIVFVVAATLVISLLLWFSSVIRVKGIQQSKRTKELFHSGDPIEPKSRRIYVDTYVFIAFFVLFDVAVFILATAFFIGGQELIAAIIYLGIFLATLLFGMQKSFSRDTIDFVDNNGGTE